MSLGARTSLLYSRPGNELVILLDLAAMRAAWWGEVAMEIRRTAFLREVAAGWSVIATCILTCDGKVVGTQRPPLELYALLEGRTALTRGSAEQ